MSESQNFYITLQDLFERTPYPVLAPPKDFIGFGRQAITFFGHPVLIKSDKEIIVFVKCAWCGSVDGKIENDCCGHCGEWIS